ncbi:MAG TPA: HDIG domain-containing protein [Bacteroidales bacterium]|nr:HDIG domain-containing protein [Bacteroidales bacterium]
MKVLNDKNSGRLSYLYKTVFFAGAVLLIVALFPKQYKFKYHFTQDKPWMYEDLIAPFDFTINKTKEEINSEKEKVIRESIPYFIFDKNIVHEKRNLLAKKINTDNRAESPDTKQKMLNVCLAVFDSVYKKGILRFNDMLRNKEKNFNVYVVCDNVAEKKTLGDLYTLREAHQYIINQLNSIAGYDKNDLLNLIESVLIQNVTYSPGYTNQDKYAAIQNISSTKGYVQKNERIISKGELINANHYQILQSLKEQYEGKSGGIHSYYFLLLGQVILISIAIIMLVLFLMNFRADIIADNKKTLLILSVLLLVILSASILIRRYGNEYIYVLPLCIVPLMIRTFYDTRLALFVHLISIILIGFLVPDGFEFIFLQLIAGIVTIISIVRLEKRSQFFMTSLYIFCTYSLIYIGMTLMQSGSYKDIASQNFMYFAFNSALTLIAYPLIVVYEKIFGYVTNVSLLEYSNTNNSLLRALSQKAPGTFQHSIQVANLAEEAAHRIGANALLVRAGAMFHDVGKIDNPVYFIENQLSENNPHEKLSFDQSAKIIVGHVEKGIIIARKYGIPEQIVDFIRTHHGTKRAEYFYRLYKKQDTKNIDESVFNYPGPVPFTKETALLMMADSVEAATRSLKKPDKQSIDDLVDTIIDELIACRQMKHASITMKDITRVKSVLKNRLVSMHHIRIEYPEKNNNSE